MKATDQYFDGIADKFVKNIYGTTKGKLRHLLLLDALAPQLQSPTALRVADIGGGSGIMTKEFVNHGHQVTLIDASADVLALAREYLADCSDVDIRHATIQSVESLQEFDLIICHAVLEWLAEPLPAITSLYEKMAPGAMLSLSFFNKDAALFGNAVYGNFDYIAKGMKVKNQVRLNPNNPLPPKQVIDHAESLGFVVERVSGIRCFHDYMKDKHPDEQQFAQLIALERQYMQTEPYCWLGKYMHLLLKKPG